MFSPTNFMRPPQPGKFNPFGAFQPPQPTPILGNYANTQRPNALFGNYLQSQMPNTPVMSQSDVMGRAQANNPIQGAIEALRGQLGGGVPNTPVTDQSDVMSRAVERQNPLQAILSQVSKPNMNQLRQNLIKTNMAQMVARLNNHLQVHSAPSQTRRYVL